MMQWNFAIKRRRNRPWTEVKTFIFLFLNISFLLGFEDSFSLDQSYAMVKAETTTTISWPKLTFHFLVLFSYFHIYACKYVLVLPFCKKSCSSKIVFISFVKAGNSHYARVAYAHFFRCLTAYGSSRRELLVVEIITPSRQMRHSFVIWCYI